MAVVVVRSRWMEGRSNRAQFLSLTRTVSGAGLVLLAGISGWLFLRRMTGALSEPLDPFALLAAGATAVSGAVLDLNAWERFEHAHPDTFASMYQFWCDRNV